MANDQRVMYDRFSDKGAHSAKWFEIAKNFLNLAFAADHREAKCSCNRCQNSRMLSEYEISSHIARHQHGVVQAAALIESDEKDDDDRMDDMIADIGMEYDLESGDQHPLPEV
jgi:hypothetical protein